MYLMKSPRQRFSNTSQAANNYHGLMNQGSTCYLNSVLQVLFMTKEFREAVRRFSDGNPHTEVIDHQLKALFDDLQKYTAYTYNISKKLGIDNVFEQRDAAEYFERVLRQTSSEASQIFHGLLANRITCQQCHTETDSDAPFWHLPLSLVDSCSDNYMYSVVNTIKEFFRSSVLCGENQMYCEECEDKVDATLTDVMKDHPDVLILLLKRFEFSFDHMSYVKISCSVELPYSLQIPESHTYELYAVVDHSGNLRSGHYTATIRIQDDKDRWFHFDDTTVTQAAEQLFQKGHTERSQTAYILFYRKKEGKEKKRKRKGDETTAELCNNPAKVIFTGKDKDETEMIRPECGAAEESPPLKVDPSESEAHVETLRNGGTGVKELDPKERVQDGNTGVDDVRQSRADNNHQIKPEVRDRPEKKSHEDDPDDEELDKYRENTEKHQGGEENSFDPADVHDTKEKSDSDEAAAEMSFKDQEEVGESKGNIKEDQKQGEGQSDHSDPLNMQEISVTQSADEAVSAERRTRNVMEDRRGEEGKDRHTQGKLIKKQDHNKEHIQTRENSSQRRQEGERRIQEAGRSKKIRAGSSQSDVRAGTGGDTGERRSQKSQPQITKEIRQKTSECSFNKGETNTKFTKTKDSVDTLSTGIHSLTLDESTLQEQEIKRRKQKYNENFFSESAKLPKFSGEIEALGLDHAEKKRNKKRWSFSLKRLKGKKKEHRNKSAKPKKTWCSCISPGSDSY